MPKSPFSPQSKLLRVLGVGFGVAAVVGGMVGQGILRTPGIVAGALHTPELMLLAWLVGAVLVAISAFAYVELGSAIPRAGGPYDYVRRAFGPLAGAVTGWAVWLIAVTVEAFLAIVVAEFLHRLGVWQGISTSALAVAVLALFCALNWTGTRISADSQIAFSAFKGAALIGLVILLFVQPTAQHSTVQQHTVELTGAAGIAAFAVAMRAVMNTYGGWPDVVYFSEEMKTPGKTLPRSMATGIVSVAVLYLLVNAALLHALSSAEMAGSELPAADAAQRVLGPSGEFALVLFGIISVAAITNLTMMRSARIAFALARGGQLPTKFSKVASTGTPRPALALSSILAAAFAATGTYQTLVATEVALSAAVIVVVNLTALRLRATEPDLPRPFRVPLYPLPVVLALALNLTLLAGLIFEDPLHSVEGLALLAAMAAVYLVLQRLRERPQATTS